MEGFFETEGVTKDAMYKDLNTIHILSNRLSSVSKDLDAGNIDKASAHDLMNASEDVNEEIAAHATTTGLINDLYLKTTHPGAPIPIANKGLTKNLLNKLIKQLSI